MATKEEILESIESMTVLEFKELLDEFKERFDVTAAAPVMMGAMPAGGDAAVEDEQSEFDVILSAAGDKKIGVIKAAGESPATRRNTLTPSCGRDSTASIPTRRT